LDLDLAILEEKPDIIIDASSNEEKVHYKAWKRYKRGLRIKEVLQSIM